MLSISKSLRFTVNQVSQKKLVPVCKIAGWFNIRIAKSQNGAEMPENHSTTRGQVRQVRRFARCSRRIMVRHQQLHTP